MARERGHEVQIVGNFFLEEKKKISFLVSFLFPLTRILYLLNELNCSCHIRV